MDNSPIPRVIGDLADPADFPYQVQILYGKNFLCAGSVLTTYLILTAAHCFKMRGSALKNYRYIKVRRMKGKRKIGLAGPPILHERWAVDKSMEYDIALLELSDHLNDVSPAILSKNDIYNPAGDVNDWTSSMVTVSGWGVSKDRKKGGVDLNAANLTISKLLDCQTEWDDTMPEKTFCARGDGVDACEGDSGGPTTCRLSYDFDGKSRTKSIVCGIVSYGNSDDIKAKGENGTSLRPCGQTNITKAGVYTDVTQYTNWILQESCPIRTNRNSTSPSQNVFVCCNMFSIAKENECDGFEDCLDGSDESNCFAKKAHKQCLRSQELCAKAKVTYTVLAPTFVYSNSIYQLHIFLGRAATNPQYTFRAWFIDGSDFSDPVTIQDGNYGIILIPLEHLFKSTYTLVVEAVDVFDDSAYYLRKLISVGQGGRTMIFTDRDVYEIGDYVNLTAVFLDPPSEDSTYNVSISVKDSRGNFIWKYYHDDVSSSPTSVSYRFPITSHGNRGDWTVHLIRHENHPIFDEPLKTNVIKKFQFTGSQFLKITINKSSTFSSARTSITETSKFFSIPNQTFTTRAERPLKIRLLDISTHQIKQGQPLQIQVETVNAIDVAHLIVYSAGEIVFAKSYHPTIPGNFTIKMDCPYEVWREAKLVVFGYINEIFVSDKLDLKVVNWTQKTNNDLGLSVSVDTIEVEQKIKIFIQAKPNSTVYLHAQDAAFEDPDEFASRKWLNTMLKPSRTPQFASNLWVNFTGLRRLELEILTNVRSQNPLTSQISFYGQGQKVTDSKQRIWLSQVINITNATTALEFIAPSTQAEWKIKGFVVIQKSETRRIEMLPVTSLKTIMTMQLPPSVISNETFEIPIFINNFMSENASETINITVRSNGSINFGENRETAISIVQRPGNKTNLVSVIMSFNQVGQFPIIVEVIVNGTLRRIFERVLNVRPNWGNTAAALSLSDLPSSDLMAMFADNLDNFASAYGSGSAESNLLLMTTSAALLNYWYVAEKKDDVWKKGIESLQIAYQNQLAFKRSDGSFAEFANLSSNSIWLTAWTIQAFVAAEKFIYIDDTVIKDGLSFLTSKLTDLPNIEVPNVERTADASKISTGTALTAFTLVTLLKASHHCNCSDSIQWAREFLGRNLMADNASLYEKALIAHAEDVWEENNPRKTGNVSEYLTNLNLFQRENNSSGSEYKELSPALKVEFHSYMSLMYYHRNIGRRNGFEINEVLEYLKIPFGFANAHGIAVTISTLAKVATMELNFPSQVKIFDGRTYICSGAVLAPYLILTGARCFKDFSIGRIESYKNIGVLATNNRVRIGLSQPPILHEGFARKMKYRHRSYRRNFDYSDNVALLELEQDLRHVQSVILSSVTVYNEDGDINTREGINGIVTREGFRELLSGNVLMTDNPPLIDKNTCHRQIDKFHWYSGLVNEFCVNDVGWCKRNDVTSLVTNCWINYINTKSLKPIQAVKKVLCGLYQFGRRTCDLSTYRYSDIAKYIPWIMQKSHKIRKERGGNCSADEFQCRNYFCIPKSSECDGFPDCLDGSDEQQCLSLQAISVYNKTFCVWHKGTCSDISEPKSQEVCFKFFPFSGENSTYDIMLKSSDSKYSEDFRRQQTIMGSGYGSFVYTDKYFYSSNDIIHFGAVFLDIPRRDSNISIHIRLHDSSNNIVWQTTTNSALNMEKGFLSDEILASRGESGTWKIIMRRQENSTGMTPVDATYEKTFEVKTNRPGLHVRFTNKNINGGLVSISAYSRTDNRSMLIGPCQIKIAVVDEWGGYLSRELKFHYLINSHYRQFVVDVTEITRNFPQGRLEAQLTVVDRSTRQEITELAWTEFSNPGIFIQEINSHRVRRPGLSYHAQFQVLNKNITSIEDFKTTTNIQLSHLENGTFTIEIPASASNKDEYFQINYINASFDQNVPRVDSNAEHFLQIRLLVGSAKEIFKCNILRIHVMTTDVVDVLHMIIYSDSEIIFSHSYPTNNAEEYVIETRCPKEIGRNVLIVVFTEIHKVFVSDAIYYKLKNGNENTNADVDLNISPYSINLGNITITMKALPNSFVYLHVEDPDYEDPDEFASKTWLIEHLLQLSRTNESAKNFNFTDVQQLDFLALTNPENQKSYAQNFNSKSKYEAKGTTRNKRVLISKMIEVTDEYTTVDITATNLRGIKNWKIKGYCIVKESQFRRVVFFSSTRRGTIWYG